MFKRTALKASLPSTKPAEGIGERVLRFLESQDLPATPANYALGYLRATDRGSLAARAVDAILMAGAKVTPEQADHIVSAYNAASAPSVTDGEEDPNCVRLRHQTLHLADLAASAAAATGQFGRDLNSELAELGRSGLPVATVISDMIERSGATERQLAAAANKIEALRHEVAVARNDAQIDALTGLTNRRGLEAEMSMVGAHQSGALAICDIDRFKVINDRYGHPVGDRVLKAVASVISENCSPHIVARWGGEEFVVVMHGIDLTRAGQIIASANASLAEKTFRVRETDESVGAVTFSAGVVCLHGQGIERAIEEADVLLYQAKVAGRNCLITSAMRALAA